MSTESHSKWWIKSKGELAKVRDDDLYLMEMSGSLPRSLATDLIGGLFSRYSRVIQDLDACLDQMIQVQKSFNARKLMNAAVTRLHELKDLMTNIDLSEYHYFDGQLIERKLIPHSVEILHPSLIYPRLDKYEQFWKRLKNGEKIYTPSAKEPKVEEEEKVKKRKKSFVDPVALLKTYEKEKAAEPEKIEPSKPGVNEEAPQKQEEEDEEDPEKRSEARKALRKAKKIARPKFHKVETIELTGEERIEEERRKTFFASILLIQTHDRARQARIYYRDVCAKIADRNLKSRTKSSGLKTRSKRFSSKNSTSITIQAPSIKHVDIKGNAAIVIQKYWRGYLTRKRLARKELQKRFIIGMIEHSWKSHEEQDKFERDLERRREIRDQAFREYYKAIEDERARILRVVAPGLFEDIGDEIREWFKRWWYTAKQLQDLPDEEKGGTVVIIRGETVTPEEFLGDLTRNKKGISKEQMAKEKAKLEAEKKKQKEKEIEKMKKEKEEAGNKEKNDGENYEFKPTKTLAMKSMQDAIREYRLLWNDVPDDPLNRIHMHFITDKECYENQLRVREKVDEAMRIELEILKIAIQKDRWMSKKHKGKFKPKKSKPKKKKKEKNIKDPTGNRPVEDLFQELYENGIIRPYPKQRLEDFKGDFSYQNWEQRHLLKDPPAVLADVRQAVVMNCIYPLGVETLEKPKSVLIVGHRQSGKHLLANAIFNETRCVLFDLSPSNIAGKYASKKDNKLFIHLIQKMTRLLAPSIIFIDGAEKPFYKKVPKEERHLQPKTLGKFLFKKIVKQITPADRVLVVGITGNPWLAQEARLKKAFQRIILIPRTDYGSVYMFWRELLMPYHGVDRNIDLSCIAKLSVGYPLPELKAAVERVLRPIRIIQLSYKPLEQFELLNALLHGSGPVTDKEWAKYEKFYNKTKLGKARMKLMRVLNPM